MKRPTTKDVEFALEWFAQGSGPGAALAAEVRALIAERDAILQAVGVAQDVEEGRDPIEAARSVREANALYCEDQNAKAEEIERLREELAEARRNAELHNDAANAAELRIVELRARLEQMRRIDTARLAELADAMAMRATITRVEALCHMQHEDSAVSIGDIRRALRGDA